MADQDPQCSPFQRFAKAIAQILCERRLERTQLEIALKRLETEGNDAHVLLSHDSLAPLDADLRRSAREFKQLYRPRITDFDGAEVIEGQVDNKIFATRRLRITYGDGHVRLYNFTDAKKDWTSVAVVDEEGWFHLITQSRPFTTQHACIETPGGFIDDGETPEEAAIREVAEEVRQSVSQLIHLGMVRENHGSQNAKTPLFLARVETDKQVRAQELDETERRDDLRIHRVSPLTARALLEGGFFVSACQNIALERGMRVLRRTQPHLWPHYMYKF